MDLLAQRYASPFLILDEFIRLKQFHEFIVKTTTMIADERIHDLRWDYWLHKVCDMSFEEYVRRCERIPEVEKKPDYAEIGSIINNSKLLLNNFTSD